MDNNHKESRLDRPFDESIRMDNVIFGSSNFDNTYFNNFKRNSSRIKRPLFIVGSPRSGTTVLGKSLGLHSLIASSEESLFLLHMWRIYSDLYMGDNRRKTTNLKDYLSSDQLLLTIGNFSDEIFGNFLAKENKHIYLDHSPWYGSIASFIKVIYPDAQFIHIIRDGREVVRSLSHSYAKGFQWAGSSIEYRTGIWKNSVENCLKIKENYPNDYYEIYYKDLIESPEQSFKDICKKLDIAYETNILEGLNMKHAFPSSTSLDPKMRDIDYDPEGWPREWTDNERKEFSRLAGYLNEIVFKKSI